MPRYPPRIVLYGSAARTEPTATGPPDRSAVRTHTRGPRNGAPPPGTDSALSPAGAAIRDDPGIGTRFVHDRPGSTFPHPKEGGSFSHQQRKGREVKGRRGEPKEPGRQDGWCKPEISKKEAVLCQFWSSSNNPPPDHPRRACNKLRRPRRATPHHLHPSHDGQADRPCPTPQFFHSNRNQVVVR